MPFNRALAGEVEKAGGQRESQGEGVGHLVGGAAQQATRHHLGQRGQRRKAVPHLRGPLHRTHPRGKLVENGAGHLSMFEQMFEGVKRVSTACPRG